MLSGVRAVHPFSPTSYEDDQAGSRTLQLTPVRSHHGHTLHQLSPCPMSTSWKMRSRSGVAIATEMTRRKMQCLPRVCHPKTPYLCRVWGIGAGKNSLSDSCWDGCLVIRSARPAFGSVSQHHFRLRSSRDLDHHIMQLRFPPSSCFIHLPSR